jgi:CDP-6-deoxy-D-xylo-4-hexulose-3-dehydrase
VNPIIQNGLIPVFVDVDLTTYNTTVERIEAAIGPRTRAIMIAHALGNPYPAAEVAQLAQDRGLFLVEDNCDAVGSLYQGRLTGTFGDVSTVSFYPAHHITMGEGGGVAINDFGLQKTALSIRDWGRDCWCDPGKSNTCGTRFEWQCGELPCGYDHKYIYSNIGYNFKVTDLQAAIGLAQADKLEQFVEARRHNFRLLYEGLEEWEEYLILPKIDPRANPSPFGFALTVRPGIERTRLVQYLEDAHIETRLVFGGNVIRQPGFLNIEKRVHGDLRESDVIMRDTFFIGVYPGMTPEMIDYMLDIFRNYFTSAPKRGPVVSLAVVG